MRRGRLQQLEPAHPIRIQGLTFSILRGDIVLQLTCQRHKYVIRESKECWDKVPVEPIGFVDDSTKVFNPHVTKVPCSATYLLTVHVLTPKLRKRPLPLKSAKHLLAQPLDDCSIGGLYSQQELEEWCQLLSFPAY
jgi:hypothetical protein